MLYNETFMRFPNGLSKALTLSYDDGVEADKKLLAVMSKYGLKGTFNLNSGVEGKGSHNRMSKTETYNTFSASNQEIALHGVKHLFLTKLSVPRGIDEVLNDRKALEATYNRIVNGMAYAYGAFNEEVKQYLALCGVDYARTTVSTRSFDIPTDWLELNPTCHHNDKELMPLLNAFIAANPDNEIKRKDPLLFYLWGHSYEFDENDNWQVIENFAVKAANLPDVWYATNGEIYRYVQAYNSLVFSVNGNVVYNPSAVDVWFCHHGATQCVPSGATIICK